MHRPGDGSRRQIRMNTRGSEQGEDIAGSPETASDSSGIDALHAASGIRRGTGAGKRRASSASYLYGLVSFKVFPKPDRVSPLRLV